LGAAQCPRYMGSAWSSSSRSASVMARSSRGMQTKASRPPVGHLRVSVQQGSQRTRDGQAGSRQRVIDLGVHNSLLDRTSLLRGNSLRICPLGLAWHHGWSKFQRWNPWINPGLPQIGRRRRRGRRNSRIRRPARAGVIPPPSKSAAAANAAIIPTATRRPVAASATSPAAEAQFALKRGDGVGRLAP
jgi:hypothetical protein